MKYRILAEHRYMLITLVFHADTLQEAVQLAAKLTILDYDLMEPTLDKMENEYITIVNVEAED
jgi:hypothetical protein